MFDISPVELNRYDNVNEVWKISEYDQNILTPWIRAAWITGRHISFDTWSLIKCTPAIKQLIRSKPLFGLQWLMKFEQLHFRRRANAPKKRTKRQKVKMFFLLNSYEFISISRNQSSNWFKLGLFFSVGAYSFLNLFWKEAGRKRENSTTQQKMLAVESLNTNTGLFW